MAVKNEKHTKLCDSLNKWWLWVASHYRLKHSCGKDSCNMIYLSTPISTPK